MLIHGLVRDDQGRKMSKSLGGIDPLEMIDRYGSDAPCAHVYDHGQFPQQRYAFLCRALRGNAQLCQQALNASRYVMMNLSVERNELPALSELETADKWITLQLNTLIADVTEIWTNTSWASPCRSL